MLTDAQCRNATCPADKKRARLTDGAGLYLEISPAGSKRWFLKLYRDGKETRLALGSYPAVGLTAARRARDAVKLQKAEGQDPIQARKVEKLKATNPAGDSFKVVALEWFEKQEPQWSEAHAVRAKRQFERDLFPWLGDRRLADIEPVELLAMLRKIEERGAIETADRGLMLARQVWRYGVATGRINRDITGDLKGALAPYRGTHFAAISLLAGDVLMNEGGDYDKVGRGAVWTGEISPCLHQNHVFAVRPMQQDLSEWLAAITQTQYAKFYFMNNAKQSTNLASISHLSAPDRRRGLAGRALRRVAGSRALHLRRHENMVALPMLHQARGDSLHRQGPGLQALLPPGLSVRARRHGRSRDAASRQAAGTARVGAGHLAWQWPQAKGHALAHV